MTAKRKLRDAAAAMVEGAVDGAVDLDHEAIAGAVLEMGEAVLADLMPDGGRLDHIWSENPDLDGNVG